MVFKVGETVVYPHHGAALIEEINTRTIKGEDKLYLKLKVAQGDLTIEVPAENCDLVGVRDVVGQEGLDRVFEVLRAPHTEEPTNWSRRYKANLEKLASGDVIKVAEVVRDLWRRDQDRGLSAGEKRMLAKARQILVSELALAEKTDEDKAETDPRRGPRLLIGQPAVPEPVASASSSSRPAPVRVWAPMCPRRSCPSRACPCSGTPCEGRWHVRTWRRWSSCPPPRGWRTPMPYAAGFAPSRGWRPRDHPFLAGQPPPLNRVNSFRVCA